MSYFYRTGLSEVVNSSLAYTSKDVTVTKGAERGFQRQTPNQFILDAIEDFEEEEELQRNSIAYQAFMKHEVLYMQFKQRSFATFTPHRPSQKEMNRLNRKFGLREDAADDHLGRRGSYDDEDVEDGNDSVSNATTTNDYLRSSESAGTLGGTYSSVDSSVWNEKIREELLKERQRDFDDGDDDQQQHQQPEIDEIDIRIAQLQHKRERQGKRRLRYQKEHDRAWSSLRKSAPLDNLLNVERESRLDIQEIEEEYLFEIEEVWEKNAMTQFILFHIEEMKARNKIFEEEVDDAGDVAQKELELDDLLEEEELRRVCIAEGIVRQQRSISTRQISSTRSPPPPPNQDEEGTIFQERPPTAALLQQQQESPTPPPPPSCIDGDDATMNQQEENNNHNNTSSPSPSASGRQQRRQSSSSPDFAEVSFLKRERLPVPMFQSFNPPKKPAPPPQPKSDDQIEREMKCRKERYARETLYKLEDIERNGIYAHFMNDPLPTLVTKNTTNNDTPNRDQDDEQQQQPDQKFYQVGSIEERLANMHRMDCRAPTM